mmetsp:Transcript_45688/g.75605  ORF Transcript_45688/g.75605 Transcript_45688/m.75605 type:complete len:208 (-) Transcript_45688:291-914(-)
MPHFKLLLVASLLSGLAATASGNGSVDLATGSSHPQIIQSLVRKVEAMSLRIERLQAQLAQEPCKGRFPTFETSIPVVMKYAGCNSNVLRNTTTNIQTCQNGTFSIYNTNNTATTGLFDIQIAVNDPPRNDVYHFVCTLTTDEPHVAFCTLTWEEPSRPEGPAWLNIRFKAMTEPACTPTAATIVGTYFYDFATNAAGVYSFYARVP